MPDDTLSFKIAPHIVEDLGLNLYTDLPRVLVEFVANAYDADASAVALSIPHDAIHEARLEMRRAWRSTNGARAGLAHEELPEELEIVIEDDGHGMGREDLASKFLVAGRRRREEDDETHTPDGRALMGRKGLGKLAGFGVAKRIEVTSRLEGEEHATRITLDYDEIVRFESFDGIPVPAEQLADGDGLPDTGGTRIKLRALLHEPVRSRPETIVRELADHFSIIDPTDFAININDEPLAPFVPEHWFAWPDPDLPFDQFVTQTLDTGDGELFDEAADANRTFAIRYRMRFTANRQALPASRRGVRVYTNGRLSAAPSLLGADTNMHGFRMTDYLDGVVHADFIADEPVDYIATDRQSLRWDTPLLKRLYDFLGAEITEACKRYQQKRDELAPEQVEADEFTQTTIGNLDLSPRDQRLAKRMAVVLSTAHKQGVEDPRYQERLPVLLSSIGHGNILAAIAELADEDDPSIELLATNLARLTQDELGRFVSTVRARIKGIETLRKIVAETDFRERENEAVVQRLFMESPWLLDPTYSQFLTADQSQDVLFERLSQELGIGDHADRAQRGADRPDLVFLLGGRSVGKLVIVELKSTNLPLEAEHLVQLLRYVREARTFLQAQGQGLTVYGELVGTRDLNTRAKGPVGLEAMLEEQGANPVCRVRDYINVVENTQAAHHELLTAYHDADAE